MFRNKYDSIKINKALDYEFNDKTLLLRALTRPSGLQERKQLPKIGHFQRLEFIGDKVLGLVMGDILMEYHPDWDEGRLTQATANYVNNQGPLAKVAENLQLGEFLIIGHGEELNHARENTKVLSDAMEALLGALWLDTGKDYSFLRKFIAKNWACLGLHDEKLIEIIRENPSISNRLAFIKIFKNYKKEDDITDILEVAIKEGFDLRILAIMLKNNSVERSVLIKSLIVTIEQGMKEKIELLLAHGANPNAIICCYNAYRGWRLSVLQIAIAQTSFTEDNDAIFEIVDRLLANGADPNWQRSSDYTNTNTDTALHRIARIDTSYNISLMMLLLHYGADVHRLNHNLQTPLHVLCATYFKKYQYEGNAGMVNMLKMLDVAGVDPNAQDCHGNTALHLLLIKFDYSLYKEEIYDKAEFLTILYCLKDMGARERIQNNSKETPLDLAYEIFANSGYLNDWWLTVLEILVYDSVKSLVRSTGPYQLSKLLNQFGLNTHKNSFKEITAATSTTNTIYDKPRNII